MSIFEKFDKAVDLKKIEEQKQAAKENSYKEVPTGKYITKIENMELGLTKKDERPMFKVQMRIVEGCGDAEKKFIKPFKKKPCIFMNRVIAGTKNDGSMIQSVETWLSKIFPDDPVNFRSYTEFAEDILDCAEACEDLEFQVDYDPDRFDSIKILDVFDA